MKKPLKIVLIIFSVIIFLLILLWIIIIHFVPPIDQYTFCHCKFDNFRVYPDEETGKWATSNDIPYEYDKIFPLDSDYLQKKYKTDLKFKHLLVPKNITMKQYHDCKYGSKECDKSFGVISGNFGDYFIMENDSKAFCECRK